MALLLVAPVDPGHPASRQSAPEIVAVDLAGRQTILAQDAVAPAVARDGRIAFVGVRERGLYVMDSDGSNSRRLQDAEVEASLDSLDFSQAAWSPDGDTIAFDGLYMAVTTNCTQHCSNWEVSTIGADGSGIQQLALAARAPAWSPDGSRLAYESGIDSYYLAASMTIARRDGLRSVQLKAANGESDIGPVWSPRGGEVAFHASASGNSKSWIYVVRADGSRMRRLAPGRNPSWSADGRRLAFVEGLKLLTIGRDGKGKRRLSGKGEFVVSATWAPRSSTIAYVAGTKAPRYGGSPTGLRLETVSGDGKRVRVLLRDLELLLSWRGPVWTTDGKRLLVTLLPH